MSETCTNKNALRVNTHNKRTLKLNNFDFTILLDNGQNYTSCQLSMSKSQLENYLYFSCYGDLQTRVS